MYNLSKMYKCGMGINVHIIKDISVKKYIK